MSREIQLLTALEAALEYIDAIPKDAAEAFPAMPGFDRDDVDALIYSVRHEVAIDPLPVEAAETLFNRLYDVLGAAGTDCMEVADRRGPRDAFGAQAAERADIIRDLIGDKRYFDNPLRELIKFAKSQITK